MKKEDASFYAWLRDEIKLNALEVLNKLNTENNYQEEDLKWQYSEYLENNKLSEEVIEKLKELEKGYFSDNYYHIQDYDELSSEQKELIDRLITNQELYIMLNRAVFRIFFCNSGGFVQDTCGENRIL